MVRDYCRVMEKDQVEVNDWLRSVFPSRREIINLTPDQMETRTGTGIELINDVITQPYYFDPCAALETDENWLTLLDANGSWVINTRIKVSLRESRR